MSSKTSMKRFWHFILLSAFIATGFGCGSGGGGSSSNKGGSDASAPRFTGLETVGNDNGNVVLTSKEATDDQTSPAEMNYLIYVATSPEGVQRNGETPYVVTGAQACSGGQCTFTLTDLNKDGNTTYYFGSHARDASGKLDEDAHPTEGTLTVTPLMVAVQPPPGGSGENIIASSSLNINKSRNAVHPALAIVGDQRYLIWEECEDDPGAIRRPDDTIERPTPGGWEDDHPCAFNTPSQIYVRQGANWDLLTDSDPALGGRSDLTRNASGHSHSPTLAFDGTTLYTAWTERGIPTTPGDIFVRKFDAASGWTDTGFPSRGFDGWPALTRHPILGAALGMGFERSAGSNRQLFFQTFDGGSWQSAIGPLNKDAARTAEAPVFSKKGDLYVTWKEMTRPTAPTIPNIFVKRWSNTTSTWDDVAGGAPLNLDTEKEARYPSIDVLGNVPYVVWHECFDAGCSRKHIFVKRLEGSQWIQVKDTGVCGEGPTADRDCGSLNISSRDAKTPSLAVHNDKVFVAWSERDTKTNKWAVRIKRLDGDTWVPLTLPQDLFVNNAHSPMLYANGSLHIAWVEENEAGVLQLIVAKLG